MGLKPQDVAVKVRENLDLFPSNETLAAAELYLAGRQNRDRILSDRLASAREPLRRHRPRLLAVALAHEPERARLRRRHPRSGRVRLPLARRRAAGHQDGEERQRAAPPPGADLRRAADVLRRARAHLPRRVGHDEGALRRPLLPADPRDHDEIKEAPAQGKTIFEYAPDSNAASDYQRVVERLITGHCGELGDDADAESRRHAGDDRLSDARDLTSSNKTYDSSEEKTDGSARR